MSAPGIGWVLAFTIAAEYLHGEAPATPLGRPKPSS